MATVTLGDGQSWRWLCDQSYWGLGTAALHCWEELLAARCCGTLPHDMGQSIGKPEASLC